MPATSGRGRPKNLILTAMIFTVSMTFIDMTIISIAVPPIQRDLGLSTTGVQWTVNAYLLTLAALFAFGGRLSYGEATGITQTVRNYAASMGIAVLGTILVTVLRFHVTSSLTAMGVPGRHAAARAARIAQSQGRSSAVAAIPWFVRADFARASQTVFLVMAAS
jgi:MFS family permease